MSDDARMIEAFKTVADALEPFSGEMQARILASMMICLGREELVVSKIDRAQQMFHTTTDQSGAPPHDHPQHPSHPRRTVR